MLSSLRKDGLTSLFKEVRVFKDPAYILDVLELSTEAVQYLLKWHLTLSE